ncbi:MAG: signal peptidase II [Microgenomates group bacterium]
MLNRGVAFGLWPGISNLIIGSVLIALMVYAVKVRELIVRLGLGLMIMGGAGNLYGRIVYGGVRDNLNFFGLFYNNVWDYLIVGGAVICLFYLARPKI